MTDDTTKPAADPAVSDPLSDYAAYERRKAVSVLLNKDILFSALSTAGVSTVVVAFDGGDSGQIEDVAVRAGDSVLELPDSTIELARAEWNTSELQRRSMPLHDAVETLAWDVLSSTHGGWENNDGGFGEVVFDVKAGSIRLDFNLRFTDSEFHQHRF